MAVKIRRLGALLLCILSTSFILAQDGSTSAIRGTVADVTGARIAACRVVATENSTGLRHETSTDAEGAFWVQMLRPGEYALEASAPGMSRQTRMLELAIGSSLTIHFVLSPAGLSQSIEVTSRSSPLEPENANLSGVIDEKTISETPLNGRRFSDLALLVPGTTQDPRGLTSGSNGDLSAGGRRGFNTSFLVDGADFNNGFYAQARGRYRAPYQFSNDVVQEFRVSSQPYSAESGGNGGPVVSVLTKSGGNQLHGSVFYYVRDSKFNAQHPFSDVKPADRQNQWGFTVGGPLRRRKLFFFGGWDQHRFRTPNVVRFLDGTRHITPVPSSPGVPGDYDPLDQELVERRLATLSGLANGYTTALDGYTGFLKLDATVMARHNINLRFSNSALSGDNNVFFDPARPVTFSPVSANGREQVRTDSVLLSLTSLLNQHASSHARIQLSRDLQQSFPNSQETLTSIDGVTEGYGRSDILPRRTREHRLHAAETLIFSGPRNDWKIGGDALLTWIYNYFPSGFGGEYGFGSIRTNPFDFTPMTYGERLTPLRAWAHGVPAYYVQDFGSAESSPNTREYAAFVQDSLRLGNHFALTGGVRYERQSFQSAGANENPEWPDAGKMPAPSNNFAPRMGFALSIGDSEPLVIRGGYGWFYSRIPSIYGSAVETMTGRNRFHLLLRNTQATAGNFPKYPAPLVECGPHVKECAIPAELAAATETQISSFSHEFRTPMTQQASLSVEKELGRLVLGISGVHVHGERLVRTRDVNLPEPVEVNYPVYSDDESFVDDYYPVLSFGAWQTTKSLACPFPPCINDPKRPVSQVGAINVFETVGTSIYDGLTFSARKRMSRGFSFRLAYTYGKAIDDGQDALRTAGSLVQNAHSPENERALSTIDQRQRLVFQFVVEPRIFDRSRPVLSAITNGWKIASLLTVGTGRPMTARVNGDPNGDGNWSNDRLPGTQRNSLIGPDYASQDLRVTRQFRLTERYRVETLVEIFNLCNRNNKRATTTDDGFQDAAATFDLGDYRQGVYRYPARFHLESRFLVPSDAYAPRQVQFSLRLRF